MDRSQAGPGTFSFSEVHHGDLEKLRAALRQALDSSRGQRLELRLGGASVDERIIDCSIEPVRDPAGEPDKVVIVSRDVTQRRREEAAIHEARERLALALEATDQISFDVDCRVQKVHLDRNWAAFLGRRSGGETIASFDELLPLVPAEEHALIHRRYVATLKGEAADYVMEHRVRRDDGEYRWILSRARVVERDARGYAIRLTGTNRDITDRRLAEQSLRLAGRALDSMAEGLVVLDSNWRVSSVNQAFSRITGYSAEEAVGKVSRLWRDSVRNQEEPSAIVAELAARGHWEGRIVDRRRDGSAYPSWLSASTIREADGGISHYVIVFSDMSKQERDAQRVRYLAYHDGLTGLANRSMFFERCGDILRRAQRHGRRMAILFIDLDHFKSVNDSLGHLAGDVLLIEVARRLLQDLRDLDLVARLGGDEFAVLLEEIAQPSDAATVALKILGSLAQPVAIGGDEVRITASIGISCFPDDADQVENLLRQADAAMYVAKQEGRDRYQFFSPDLTARVMNRLATASALKVALDRGEFRVHYQPAVDARTGEIVGLEALLRWQHPQRGLLLPNEFIQVAEDTGVIDAIGRWVLTMACRQLALWQKSGHEGLSMKVNLSPLQFRQPTLVHDMKRILLASGVRKGTLEIEITESAAMSNPDRSERVLQDMLDLGIRVSLDDFGTGHSSLAQLSRFPIHGLKLDRSLVCGLPDDRKNVVIASSVASLCRNLGLDLVGEGVETAAQAEFLMSQGCRQMQGFYFSPAVSAEELTALLAQPDHAAWKMAGSALH
jgi:diguanylate cyclase (GGDEF)-like protein/PAS domain S-box-containing protein